MKDNTILYKLPFGIGAGDIGSVLMINNEPYTVLGQDIGPDAEGNRVVRLKPLYVSPDRPRPSMHRPFDSPKTKSPEYLKAMLHTTLEGLLNSVQESHERWGDKIHAQYTIRMAWAFQDLLYVWKDLFTRAELDLYEREMLRLLTELGGPYGDFDSMELWRIKQYYAKKFEASEGGK